MWKSENAEKKKVKTTPNPIIQNWQMLTFWHVSFWEFFLHGKCIKYAFIKMELQCTGSTVSLPSVSPSQLRELSALTVKAGVVSQAWPSHRPFGQWLAAWALDGPQSFVLQTAPWWESLKPSPYQHPHCFLSVYFKEWNDRFRMSLLKAFHMY